MRSQLLEEIIRIRTLLKSSFEGSAPWHGPSVIKVLAQVNPENIHNRQSGSHSPAELVMHMIAWRNFVIRKLQGEDHYELSESDNFPSPIHWSQANDLLMKSQEELLQALSVFPSQKLDELVPNRSYSYAIMLHGIIHHDLYHLGQIIVLTR